MNSIFIIIYAFVAGFYIVKFMQILEKMNKSPIVPIDVHELAAIRIYPEKTLSPPTMKDQKWGIIIYSFILLILIGVFVLAVRFDFNQWLAFLTLLIPYSHSDHLLNMFAVMDDGILIGNVFIPWRKIKSYQFQLIDINHKYYGFSKEINDKGYELIIKHGFFPTSCIVLNEEMKEKLTKILEEKGGGEFVQE